MDTEIDWSKTLPRFCVVLDCAGLDFSGTGSFLKQCVNFNKQSNGTGTVHPKIRFHKFSYPHDIQHVLQTPWKPLRCDLSIFSVTKTLAVLKTC